MRLSDLPGKQWLPCLEGFFPHGLMNRPVGSWERTRAASPTEGSPAWVQLMTQRALLGLSALPAIEGSTFTPQKECTVGTDSAFPCSFLQLFSCNLPPGSKWARRLGMARLDLSPHASREGGKGKKHGGELLQGWEGLCPLHSSAESSPWTGYKAAHHCKRVSYLYFPSTTT